MLACALVTSPPNLAFSRRPRLSPPQLFGDGQPLLAIEEFMSIAGVWKVDFKLGSVHTTAWLHLQAPQPQQGDIIDMNHVYPMEDNLHLSLPEIQQFESEFPPGGSVTIMPVWGKNMEHILCRVEDPKLTAGWWAASRLVRAGEAGDDKLILSLQLGDLYLEGQGQRGGLRCRTFVGKVVESGDEPCEVGRFAMQLALPIKTDTTALETRYRERIASRPPPPLDYPRSGFAGRWRLLLSVDDSRPPASYPVELFPDGSWESFGTEETLAGDWGMYARDPQSHSGWSSSRPVGSSVWLRVRHERCTKTLRGTYVAGLPVTTDFELWGRPTLETEEQELVARASRSSLNGLAEAGFFIESFGGGGDDDAGSAAAAIDAIADRVDGRLWAESVEREYLGRFSLFRESAIAAEEEMQEHCEQGEHVACDALSREEEAKREWLAKQNAPSWGQRVSEQQFH